MVKNVQDEARLGWVDAARIPAMLAVVFQHMPGGCRWNLPTLSAALALFYLLAGYFAVPRLENLGYLWRRVKQLLLAYLLWSGLWAVGSLLDPTWLAFVVDDPWGALRKVLGVGCTPFLTPMWFIRDLIVFLLIGACLQKLPRWVLPVVTVCCVSLHAIGSGQAWPRPYMLGDFLLGMCLAPMGREFADRWSRLPLSVHGGIVGAYAVMLIVQALVHSWVYGPLVIPGIFALLSMGVLLDALPRKDLIRGWAQATFFIYCSHIFFFVFIRGIEQLTGDFPKALWYMIAVGIDLMAALIYAYGKKSVGQVWRERF
jgi:fucose 4-O-acetylase-like acetyltransferase